MRTASRRGWLPSIALFLALLTLCVPHRAFAAQDVPTEFALETLGFAGGATITGTNPRFDLYVPDYHSGRKLEMTFSLAFPPLVDPKAIVVLRVDGNPLASTTVDALRNGTLHATFTAFRGTGRMLDVSVESYLTVSGRSCNESDPRSLWMFVTPKSRLVLWHFNAAPATVAEFFEDYDGRYAVTVAPNAADDLRRNAIALGYWLNQLERWRPVRLTFLSPPQPNTRTIVVENASQDLAVRNGVLHASVRGIDLIAARAAASVVEPSTSGSAIIKGKTFTSPVTLDQLGIGTRTQKGAGQMKFPVGFTLGTFGDLPNTLHFTLELSHGPYRAGDRAAVTVLLNGAVVNGFTLSQAGKLERFDVPIDVHRLGGANSLDVTVEFIPSRQDCAGGQPSLTISLLGSSEFSWRGSAGFPPTIGEFFNQTAGHAELAISDAALDPYAFVILDRLGAIDPNVTALSVRRLDASPDPNVRATIEVADPQALAGIPMAYDPATGRIVLKNGAGKSVYDTTLDTPYGILQTLRLSDPALVVTYAKSPQALDALGVASASELSSARYDVLLFNAKGIAFTNPGSAIAAQRKPPTPVRSSWPLIVLFVILVAVALVLIARRARRVS